MLLRQPGYRKILERNLGHPSHRFWKMDIGLSDAVSPFADRFAGHQQTTDAYLLGLAIHKSGISSQL
jgi:hypothetical protein